jgi:hypothetical protein
MILTSQPEPIQAAQVALDLGIEELEPRNAATLGASPVTGDTVVMIGLVTCLCLHETAAQRVLSSSDEIDQL